MRVEGEERSIYEKKRRTNHLGMRTKDARHIKRREAHLVFHVNRLVCSVVQEPAHEVDVSFCGGPVEGCGRIQLRYVKGDRRIYARRGAPVACSLCAICITRSEREMLRRRIVLNKI